MPSAKVRFSGGKARATTPNMGEKPLHERPMPTRTPALRPNSVPVVEYAMSAIPSA